MRFNLETFRKSYIPELAYIAVGYSILKILFYLLSIQIIQIQVATNGCCFYTIQFWDEKDSHFISEV